MSSLQELLERSVAKRPDHVAVVDPGHTALTYQGLWQLSDRIRDRLVALGVVPGDRVGIYMRKSADTVAAIFGILKAGAAYVPVDPTAPPARCAYILNDCSVRVVLTEARLADAFSAEFRALGSVVPPLVLLPDAPGLRFPLALDQLDQLDGAAPAPARAMVRSQPKDLAYILYTSGSTGKPKGVMLSQQAATSFVDWCSEVFEPTGADRFSSHAPFHFDLSILDLYVPLKHAATLVLIGEEAGKEPLGLAALIAEQKLTVWYSTPSILSLLGQYGRLERHDLSSLRAILFAGEVFPVPQLRRLKLQLPAPRYCNLYGPTETNVCTWFEIPRDIPDGQTEPYPIGKTCSHLASRVVDLDGTEVPRGEEGELVISGPGILDGYWNLPERTAGAFLVDPDGTRWYKTGDVVVESSSGDFLFRGRRDRMVKRRGYRIELGEIEACLSGHPEAREVAVVSLPDQDGGVRIKAWLSLKNGRKPSLIELKQFCADGLPKYMIPDLFGFLEALPRTSTDKIDYQTLKAHG